MDYVTFYHATPASAVESIQAGVDPGPNDYTQYGRGFYAFLDRGAAERWARLKPRLLGEDEEYVLLEFRLDRKAWEGLRRQVVPEEQDWDVPSEWLTEECFDVLEGPFAVTPGTTNLEGTWQVKFNPHTYHLLDDALARHVDEEQT